MHKPVFIFFILFFFVGGWRHEYEHYFEQVNLLSNNQKPFAVIAVKAVKTDIIHPYHSFFMCQKKLSSKIICQKKLKGFCLIKIQIEVKQKKLQFIWRESIYHGIFNLTLSIIPCFCGHTNKGSFVICSCSNSRDL